MEDKPINQNYLIGCDTIENSPSYSNDGQFEWNLWWIVWISQNRTAIVTDIVFIVIFHLNCCCLVIRFALWEPENCLESPALCHIQRNMHWISKVKSQPRSTQFRIYSWSTAFFLLGLPYHQMACIAIKTMMVV